MRFDDPRFSIPDRSGDLFRDARDHALRLARPMARRASCMTALEPVRLLRTTMSATVCAHLREQVIAGRLRPGLSLAAHR